jgi:hypothetical protein
MRTLRSHRAFTTTETELKLIAAAAIIGFGRNIIFHTFTPNIPEGWIIPVAVPRRRSRPFRFPRQRTGDDGSASPEKRQMAPNTFGLAFVPFAQLDCASRVFLKLLFGSINIQKAQQWKLSQNQKKCNRTHAMRFFRARSASPKSESA